MRKWGLRAAILLASMATNLIEAALLYPLFRRAGINLANTFLDEAFMGLAMGTVICLIHGFYRRRYERALQLAVDELNHHVRNSMQIILNQQAMCPHCNIEHVSQAIERVDWALRQVLPPEVQPERTPQISWRAISVPKQRPGASPCNFSADMGSGAKPLLTQNSPTQAKGA